MYRIIFNANEDVHAAMKGMLAPVYKESILGLAEVRQVFRITGAGTVAGLLCADGRILRSSEVRVVRDGIVVHEGKLQSLKRFKDDVREVATGYECGIAIEKFNDIKESDIIEAFEMKEVERT
jgi:translation initiation factor IF-2